MKIEQIACIDPGKDVDGLHPLNFGRFFMNQPSFVPCTPLGINGTSQRMGCSPKGKHAVVIGRSKFSWNSRLQDCYRMPIDSQQSVILIQQT